MKAVLVLEDGTVFEGESLGAPGWTYGEVVFNTGMTGYQEILTDPSYAGQMVALTYPLIGNYGINPGDFESQRVQVEGLIVRECESAPSNWRAAQTLDAFLKAHAIVGIKRIDTRALTRVLRNHGVMMGAISTEETQEQMLARIRSAPPYASEDLNRKVTAEKPYRWLAYSDRSVTIAESDTAQKETSQSNTQPPASAIARVALLDCGVKVNILRNLARLGCATTVYPCTASAADILQDDPDGVLLSPGPGDPAQLGYVVEMVRELIGKKPIMGVCLGNQILGTAFGSKTFKMKFGHRGSNHPVKELATGRITITSQNHGYAVDPDGLRDGMEVAHVNLNDGTVEGLRHRDLPIFSIQYHPEASPGPTDSNYFFQRFVDILKREKGTDGAR